jgi:hypothetical protein
MLDLDKTDLIDNVLIITNDDGSIKCIPREGATSEELELFAEFEKAFPNGKPPKTNPIPSDPAPDEITVLKKSLAATIENLSQLMDFVTMNLS